MALGLAAWETCPECEGSGEWRRATWGQPHTYACLGCHGLGIRRKRGDG